MEQSKEKIPFYPGISAQAFIQRAQPRSYDGSLGDKGAGGERAMRISLNYSATFICSDVQTVTSEVSGYTLL